MADRVHPGTTRNDTENRMPINERPIPFTGPAAPCFTKGSPDAPSEASGDFLLLPIQILGGEVLALDHGQRIVANRGFRALLQFSCLFLGGILRPNNMLLPCLNLGPQSTVETITD